MNLIFILGLLIFQSQSSKVTSSSSPFSSLDDLNIFEKSTDHILTPNEPCSKIISQGEEHPYDTSLLCNLKQKRVTFAVENEVFVFSNEWTWGSVNSKSSSKFCQSKGNENKNENKTSPTLIFDIEEIIPPESETLVITTEWIKNVLIPTFLAGKMLPMDQIKTIIKEAKNIFEDDRTIHDIEVNPGTQVIVVGDIHGQFESTLTIFEDFGFPSETNIYLFNGDVVDRGNKSVECLLMIYAFKVALSGTNTNSFFMGRGNHESETVYKGTFYNECLEKLKEYPEAFEDFHSSFEALPYGFVIRDQIFVTHGGLCPGMDLEYLRNLHRDTWSYRNVSEFYAMLWNDPCEDSMPVNEFGVAPNSRGPKCRFFHTDLTIEFLQKHNLDLFVRSHQMVPDGYLNSQRKYCLTIFSAPNYQGCGNNGAVLIITNKSIAIEYMRR